MTIKFGKLMLIQILFAKDLFISVMITVKLPPTTPICLPNFSSIFVIINIAYKLDNLLKLQLTSV